MGFIEDVAQHLHNQGIGVLGTSLFKSYMPETPDNAIAVIATGGTKPDEYLPLKSPTFQVLIRNTDYQAGDAKLQAVRTALHQKINTLLIDGGIYFYKILAIAEGGPIGRDENARDSFSINFQCETR